MNQREFLPSEQQLEIISCSAARLTVSASAGTGKTGVLMHKYVSAVESGLSPDQILAITFTRKAAAEMQSRIVAEFTKRGMIRQAQLAATGPIQTIHSFCQRFLQENSLLAAVDPQFEILEEIDTQRYLQRAIKEAVVADFPPDSYPARLLASLPFERDVREKIRKAVAQVLGLRSTTIEPDELLAKYRTPEHVLQQWKAFLLGQLSDEQAQLLQDIPADQISPATAKPLGINLRGKAGKPEDVIRSAERTCGLVHLAYEAWRILDAMMEADQRFDFNGIERKTVKLFRESAQVRERFRKQYPLTMIDEAQDLSPSQHEVLNCFESAQIMLIGDMKQAIYAFRDAEPRLFRLSIEKSTSLSLTKNYRSQASIQAFVDHVVGVKMPGYQPMLGGEAFDLDSDPVSFEGIRVVEVPEARKEAGLLDAVTEEVRRRIVDEGAAPDSICVLLSKHKQIEALKQQIEEFAPVTDAGGNEKFYTRLEVRDCANALRALSDPRDDFSMLAVLASPVVGLTWSTLSGLKERPVYDGLTQFNGPVEDRAKVDVFLAWFNPLSERAEIITVHEALGEIFARSPFLQNLASSPRRLQKIANVRKLFAIAASRPEMGLRDFAQEMGDVVSLSHRVSEAESKEAGGGVRLETIFAAKGLEFPTVIYPDFTAEAVSKPRSFEEVLVDNLTRTVCYTERDRSHLYRELLVTEEWDRRKEEAVRVLYVALTRAQKELVVVTNRNRDSLLKGSLAGAKARGAQFHQFPPE
ncbi:MAG: UvrD-helicase domain-containing protein [Armatimonadetes bacterium]|nr:UvrD-helicase domain-containing protein [Armatimonadota bacterium]